MFENFSTKESIIININDIGKSIIYILNLLKEDNELRKNKKLLDSVFQLKDDFQSLGKTLIKMNERK